MPPGPGLGPALGPGPAPGPVSLIPAGFVAPFSLSSNVKTSEKWPVPPAHATQFSPTWCNVEFVSFKSNQNMNILTLKDG